MTTLQSSFDRHSLIFWAILLLLTICSGLWLIAVNMRSRRTADRLEELLAGASSDSVGNMLVEYLGSVRMTAAAVDRMQRQHDEIARLVPDMMRHVGLVRFSPFHDTGGDQSFTLAMLDGRRDGVVITGLHSRTDSRLYAKPIRRGESEYALTPEEREAISQALVEEREQAISG